MWYNYNIFEMICYRFNASKDAFWLHFYLFQSQVQCIFINLWKSLPRYERNVTIMSDSIVCFMFLHLHSLLLELLKISVYIWGLSCEAFWHRFTYIRMKCYMSLKYVKPISIKCSLSQMTILFILPSDKYHSLILYLLSIKTATRHSGSIMLHEIVTHSTELDGFPLQQNASTLLL